MPTYTANLGLKVPTVGSDTNDWGDYLNSDLSYLDNIFEVTGTSISLLIGNQPINTPTATGQTTFTLDQIRLKDDRTIEFGTGVDYWLNYNSTGTQFELNSTDVNGSGGNGIVFYVGDGTDDVFFTGAVDADHLLTKVLRVQDADKNAYVQFCAPNVVSASYALCYPATSASTTAGQALRVASIDTSEDPDEVTLEWYTHDTTGSPLANTKIWIGDSSGDAQEFALSGDVTMTAGGLVTVADNKITLAKMEDGTSGDILYYGASGVPTRLAKGLDTQVLTLASGIPSWASPTVGDITGVTAGAGMTGGGDTGDVTLNVIGTADRITVNADDVDIASTYVGQTSITTLGTIATGVWNGTAIANANLANSSVSYGGVSVALGASDATPAFNLSDATAYVGDSSLVTTGALNSGSITSGFGAIDVGSSAISGGAGTFSSVTVGSGASGTTSSAIVNVRDFLGLYDADGSHSVSIQALDVTTASYTITLPAGVGSSGQVLQTSDASGTLEWVDPTVGDITSVDNATNGGLTVTNPTAGAVTLALNFGDLATIASPYVKVDDDSLAFHDATDGSTNRVTIAQLMDEVAGTGITATSGVLSADTVAAAAGTLTGTTLASNVVTSSLTTVGTITSGIWRGNTVTTAYGGVGQTGYTAGDILYASDATTLAKLAKGTDTHVLTMASGIPSWAAPATAAAAAGTLTGATLASNVLTSSLTTVGALASGSIASGFGSISTTSTIATTGTLRGTSIFLATAGDKFYFSDDSDDHTYMYENGADQISFVTGGTEMMQIKAPGSAEIDFKDNALIHVGDISLDSVSSDGSTAPMFYGTGSSGATAIGDAVDNAALFIRSKTGTSAGMAIGTTSGGDAYLQGCFANNSGSKTIILNPYGDNVQVTGALSKGSGSFKISHPLPDKNDSHYLVHSFVEGPRADLIYRGSVALSGGSASVDLDAEVGMTDGTWELLCRDPQVYLQNEDGWSALKGSVSGSTLIISCEDTNSTDTVSWLVVAERQDEHMKDAGTDWTDDDGRPILEPLKRTS
jgi:hypothetical protein